MYTMTIDKDGNFTIKGKLTEGRPSSSGKTKIVASTGGFMQTGQVYKEQPVSLSLNITVPNK